jgi:hypothetical protein
MPHGRIPAVATINEIVAGIDALREELAKIGRAPLIDFSLRDAKLQTFTKRAYLQLKTWGFVTEAEQGFGRNSVTNMYEGINERIEERDARLRALRDDMASHPEHYESRLATGEQSEPISAKHAPAKTTKVFLGHGRNKLWARVQIFLKDELHLDMEVWETETRAGQHSIDVLKKAARAMAATRDEPTPTQARGQVPVPSRLRPRARVRAPGQSPDQRRARPRMTAK